MGPAGLSTLFSKDPHHGQCCLNRCANLHTVNALKSEVIDSTICKFADHLPDHSKARPPVTLVFQSQTLLA